MVQCTTCTTVYGSPGPPLSLRDLHMLSIQPRPHPCPQLPLLRGPSPLSISLPKTVRQAGGPHFCSAAGSVGGHSEGRRAVRVTLALCRRPRSQGQQTPETEGERERMWGNLSCLGFSYLIQQIPRGAHAGLKWVYALSNQKRPD